MNSSEENFDGQEAVGQTILDQMVSSDQCQFLKAALPYLPPSGRRAVSLYTKLQELSNTMELFSTQNQDAELCAASVPDTDPLTMLQDIRRCCYGNSRKKLDEMINMFALMQMLQLMQEQD